MNTNPRNFLIMIVLLVLASGLAACSGTESEKPVELTYYSEEALSQAEKLVNEGYELLEKNALDFSGALIKFEQAEEYVPNGLEREYHTACVQARDEFVGSPYGWLEKLIDNGFDSVMNLQYEPDFEPIREDDRFKKLMDRARSNYEKNTAHFAAGLPAPEEPVPTFATQEELDAWGKEQGRIMRKHRRYWTEAQYMTARVNYTVARLAATEALNRDNPEYNAGLERIRAAARLKSIFDPGWGSISEMVIKEVDTYLRARSEPASADEANFQAGTALSLQFTGDDDRKIESFRRADNYLAKVPRDSKYFGAAQAMKIVNKMERADADQDKLEADLKSILDAHPGDEQIYQVMSTRLKHEGASIVWPIPLEVADVDGRLVSLDEYRGKVLLIDFWATWCGPCRAELPELVKVYNDYHPRGFEVVSISLDYESRTSRDDLLKWTEENGLAWRHVYSGEGWDTGLVKKFYVGSIPAPYLVGPDGTLIAWGEDCRGDQLKATVASALGNK